MLANAMTNTVAAMAGLSTMASDARIGYYPRPDPEAVSSATRCSTIYGSAAPPWGPSTDYFTSTSYAYRVKTQLLTPKPFTTSVSTTSTYTEWETAPNNLTKTVYTDTYTWTNYLTTTETVYSTSTTTTSVLSSTTVTTADDFTPVQANYPQATQYVDDWAHHDNWAVEDEYFQDEGDDPYILLLAADRAQPLLLDALAPTTSNNATSTPNPSGEASKVDCLVTIINVYEAGTSTTKSYVSPPTYTRTAIISTETITSTVRTRTKTNPTETPYTYSLASALEIRSWYTETTTKTKTVRFTSSTFTASANQPQTTTTEFPSSTTTFYAACATNNIIDTYDKYPLDRLAADWHSKNLTILRSDRSEVTNATACCATAARNADTIFFKYDGICEVFIDDRVADWSDTSAKINVEVLFEPRERGWWGVAVGNGPRGKISFSSLWV